MHSDQVGVHLQYMAALRASLGGDASAPATGITRNGTVTLTRRQSAALPLDGNDGSTLFTYQGRVSIGTPAQVFPILFDTGSYQFWIRSKGCTTAACKGFSAFDGAASTTYAKSSKPADPITYVDGTAVSGSFFTDTVAIGGLAVEKHLTMEATEVVLNNAPANDSAGIMGMSFTPAGAPKTFFEDLLAAGKVPAAVFSYYIDASERSGALILGAIDTARFSGPLAWLPVTPLSFGYLFWQTPMTAVSVADTKVALPSTFKAVFDTGTSLAAFPQTIAVTINTALGMKQLSANNTAIFGMPCVRGVIPNELPVVSMTFNTHTVRLAPSDYMFVSASKGMIYCVSGFQGIPETGSADSVQSMGAILGNIFLRKFYTVYDVENKRVGIAVANRAQKLTPELVTATSNMSPNGTASAESVGGAQNVNPPQQPLTKNAASRSGGASLWILQLALVAVSCSFLYAV
ncbi:aspartic peptidase domain-containing protein [Entophlyctis helioformis]|nr:aspartic peptidase domain-containing protein [Entophlyctis helioformis]